MGIVLPAAFRGAYRAPGGAHPIVQAQARGLAWPEEPGPCRCPPPCACCAPPCWRAPCP
ncbi:hypothetical protein CBM2606_A90355 [Cupriavidus taiwanensis]|nr:hypothetical protein CBM2606_A90355 [Cupriavidus taiwanensis]